ncbi:MAG: hypothetical protein H7Y05_05265, partial [Steroidobacteraceae bacterium]|nr:hypothetical protein [Deltaproteobacteria bacterium]
MTMVRIKGFLALAVIACLCMPHFAGAASPVRLRINTSHGLANARGAVIDAGLRSTEVVVTPSSPDNGKQYLPPDRFVEDARSAGATILSSSFSGWNYLNDSAGYLRLTANGLLHVYAYEPRKPQPSDAPPPAAFATVNRIGGNTGGGIEFGVPTDYMHGKGQSTSPSGVTAQVAGLMACLKYRHPSWNWFDVKAALRVTAANYPTGYDPHNYGYGAINFQNANALTDATHLALFAPSAVILGQKGDRLIFRINPFKQARRFTDVVFKFTKRPIPTLKELTLAEITMMGGEYLLSTYLYKDADTYSYRMTRG